MTAHLRSSRAFAGILLLLLAGTLALFGASRHSPAPLHDARPVEPAAGRDDKAAAAAFEAMVPVLRNPRCINCHAAGDYPRQGDDEHVHIMQVRRGPDGHGAAPVRCSTCHQDHNLVGLHMPPGAPGWALPPPAHPMIWKGLTDHQLCELIKDPQQNGYRTIAQIVEHMKTPLVLWGWHPGEGRTPIPMPEDEFERYVRVWALAGAACPVESKQATQNAVPAIGAAGF